MRIRSRCIDIPISKNVGRHIDLRLEVVCILCVLRITYDVLERSVGGGSGSGSGSL